MGEPVPEGRAFAGVLASAHVADLRRQPPPCCVQHETSPRSHPTRGPASAVGLYGRDRAQSRHPHPRGRRIANHAHVLLSLPPVISLAKAAQALKGISSKWMNEIGRGGFAWQEGYAAFSVSRSQMGSVINYVNSQPEHHRKHSFESEFLSLSTKHGIEYDPKYVFG